MKKVIENLANLFGTTAEEVLTKLNLSQDFESKDLAKVLGVYSLYSTKEEHANYVSSKLANKESEIANSQKQIVDLENVNKGNLIFKDKLKELVKKEWISLGVKRDLDKENIDLTSLDYSNLKKSIIDYANNEGLAYKLPDFNAYATNESANEEAADVVVFNGAVKK
ncbi:HtpH [Mycoplasma phage MAV1]|uniref:Uncharacterized protein n=1 Tax=Metamycoplasma arthritidis (strain 158L3-1) TaxID=243272 RepID=B3PNB1_META1|nr:hypothetical protein [Metamycoplasma arthritidis]NP_047264.1 HtpH [Mycoplasma phage MAV1]AAC33774.1 HtpH [Mycoplasma phage MAV1]ACF07513.1 bacteriophage MAV1 hypothetical protein [Metamycoplasma arthritidis 158L3-1]